MAIYALVMMAAAWVITTAKTAFDHLRIRPLPASRRVQDYGLLLVLASAVVSLSVEVGGWTQGQRHITHTVLIPLSTAGLAMVVGGMVWRSRRDHARRHSREL